MPSRYLLHCPSCQHPNEVSTTQAGQELNCSGCQASITTPRLGELKKLPPVADELLPQKPRSKSRLFVVGLLVFLIGLLAGGGLYAYAASKRVDYDVENALQETDQRIESASLIELMLLSDELEIEQESPIPAWRERGYVASDKQGIILGYIAYGFLGVGLVGLLLMIIGLFR